jgi:hypothetical protein
MKNIIEKIWALLNNSAFIAALISVVNTIIITFANVDISEQLLYTINGIVILVSAIAGIIKVWKNKK